MSGSDLSIYKAILWNIFVSTNLAPDLSSGLDPAHGISQVFCEPSDLEPHISHLWTQTGFVTSLSCDLEPDITKPTSSKIVVSDDLAPDMSVGINYGQTIY